MEYMSMKTMSHTLHETEVEDVNRQTLFDDPGFSHAPVDKDLGRTGNIAKEITGHANH